MRTQLLVHDAPPSPARGQKVACAYGIGVGGLMVVQWTFSLAAGAVEELETAPIAIAFHLAAEGATALLLIGGGVATMRARSWGPRALLFALGMVAYSEIASPGYFAQRGAWPAAIGFAVLLAGAVASAVALPTAHASR